MSLLLLFRPRAGGVPPVIPPPEPSNYGFDRKRPLLRIHVGRAAKRRVKR
jgi:hypothetical protein